MSELKRNDSQYGAADKPADAATPGIEESQPRQTLEVPRANAVWQFHREQSTDPYNSVGAHAISPHSFRTRAA